MICPDCKGEGATIADHVSYANGTHGYGVRMTCSRCRGAGEVPDAMAQWIEDGRKLRDRRVNGSPYRSLHYEAKLLGVTGLELSRQEWGKVAVTLLAVPRPEEKIVNPP